MYNFMQDLTFVFVREQKELVVITTSSFWDNSHYTMSFIYFVIFIHF